MKDDKVYIEQMLDAVRKIELFIKEFSREQFFDDQKTQSAVILQLMIIGELVKKLNPETKDKSDIQWKDISGFRDRAIHDYFGMDLEVVWATVTDDVSVLKEVLIKINI